MERLQKIIAQSGYASRRKSEELIKEGRVKVNGITASLGTKASYEDSIKIDNKKLTLEPKEYYLLYKPRGVLSSVSDDKGRKTVIDLIETNLRIYPIGRLDYNTTGLILLTNDGDLANKLMHPKNNVPKTYLAKLNKVLTMEDYFKLKNGLIIDGIKVLPTRLKIKNKDEKKETSLIEITITEGRNHIVKNLFKEIGYDVLKLKREKYAFLTLQGLKSGEYRYLTENEIEALKNL